MIVIESTAHVEHDPDRAAPMPDGRVFWERPERIEVLRKAFIELGHTVIEPPDHGLAAISAVHDSAYLSFLSTAFERWKAASVPGPVVRPSVYPIRPIHRLPEAIAGIAGYYLSSFSAPVLPATWKASLGSAHAAIEGAERIMAGEKQVFALCRPPGHHAGTDSALGFCYLNNIAVAANHLTRRGGRVAILDFDAHHGNGTQSIFYGRDDVHFASIHSDPTYEFPYYSGYADELGTESGLGHNLNLPLAAGTGDAGFTDAIDRAIDWISKHRPTALFVSVGFDAYQKDPMGNLAVTTEGFRKAGERIAGLGLPTLMVQEGGYLMDHLASNLGAFLSELARKPG